MITHKVLEHEMEQVMWNPVMDSVVERRLLVNYRIEPAVVARLLPAGFRPQLVRGWAVGGVCAIRLGSLRPRGLPAALGLTSEGCAHRFAVEWDEGDTVHRGVFIARRESGSHINVLAGDRLFPGRHAPARFGVDETRNQIALRCVGRDVRVAAAGSIGDALDGSRLFPDVTAASDFYRSAPFGYSSTGRTDRLEGMEFRTDAWNIEPFDLEHMESSYFDDRMRFPVDAIALDSAFVMRHVPATWHPAPSLDLARALAQAAAA
ncbi:MAG: DUF2071 domain-containing protein [Acidimicrobiia bacterium]